MITKKFKSLSVVVACSMLHTSCHKSTHMNVQPLASSSQVVPHSTPPIGSTDERKNKKFAVVFLHAFFGEASNLAFYKERVIGSFQDALILMPTNREGEGILISDDNQANSTLAYIREALHNSGIRDPEKFPVMLVTHSHGGKVACLMGHKIISGEQPKLNILGMYLITAPLSGFPMRWEQSKEVEKLKEAAVESGLANFITGDRIERESSYMAMSLSKESNPLRRLQMRCKGMHALDDANPCSESTEKVMSFLRKKKHNISCRLIGSYLSPIDLNPDDIRIFLDKGRQYKQMEPAIAYYKKLTEFVTDEPTLKHKHDTCIPLYSQLCRRAESFEDMFTLEGEVDNKKKDGTKIYNACVEAIVYKNLIHEYTFPFINRKINPKKTVMESSKIADDLINFIKSRFLY